MHRLWATCRNCSLRAKTRSECILFMKRFSNRISFYASSHFFPCFFLLLPHSYHIFIHDPACRCLSGFPLIVKYGGLSAKYNHNCDIFSPTWGRIFVVFLLRKWLGSPPLKIRRVYSRLTTSKSRSNARLPSCIFTPWFPLLPRCPTGAPSRFPQKFTISQQMRPFSRPGYFQHRAIK